MAEVASQSVSPKPARPLLTAVILTGLILLGVGLAGRLPVAWGYALFALSGVLLVSGIAVFAAFLLSRAGDTRLLQRWFSTLLATGAGAYVLSLAAMAGYYVHETFQGRMEWRWIVFGPSILTALIVLDYGLYRKLVKNNLPTWRRYRQYITRDQSDPDAMRRTFVDEVVLHRSLFHTSKIRWLRHTLIFWGFMAMFATELVAVIVRDGFPAFGWRDIWREQGNPIRLAFAFIFDVTGLMVVLGCLLALGWRLAVNAKPERKYSDTPTTIFLLFVVVTGFIVEGLHLLSTPSDPNHRVAFVGVWVAQIMATMGFTNSALYEPLWLVHVIAACGFIAYVPVMRLIHSCATPLGRLANSQQKMLAAKKIGVISAMLLKRER
jgi:nitrate reductase gamma subunit